MDDPEIDAEWKVNDALKRFERTPPSVPLLMASAIGYALTMIAFAFAAVFALAAVAATFLWAFRVVSRWYGI